MSEQTIHVRFINGRMDGASVVDGPVRQVALDTIRDVVERCGHPTHRVSVTRAIDDAYWWDEAIYDGTVTTSDGITAKWRHVFTKARSPWPRLSTCGATYGSNPDACHQPAGHAGTHSNRWGTTWADA